MGILLVTVPERAPHPAKVRRAHRRRFDIVCKLNSTAPTSAARYSAKVTPEPPNSAGKSLNFGSPSLIGSTDSE